MHAHFTLLLRNCLCCRMSAPADSVEGERGQSAKETVEAMPSWELFEAQSAEYREAVLPAAADARVSVEAASPFGWERYVGPGGAIIGVDRFGASAPGPEVMAHYGFTVEHVIATAMALLPRKIPS